MHQFLDAARGLAAWAWLLELDRSWELAASVWELAYCRWFEQELVSCRCVDDLPVGVPSPEDCRELKSACLERACFCHWRSGRRRVPLDTTATSEGLRGRACAA